MVRSHELECSHGIGHQLGTHGCDGCCGLIFGGLVEQTEERILKALPKQLWALVDGNLQPINVDALIKGENKITRWTDRPLTEEDKEFYGLEGENK